MRWRAFFALLILTATISSAQASSGDGRGIGVIVGEPTGLSFKKWIDNVRALDAGIAWSLAKNESLHLHVDYLFHRFDRISNIDVEGKLPLYFGVGGRVQLSDADDLVGVRAPLGISYLFPDAPIDLFVELIPILDIVPGTEFNLNAALGARYYF
jgi:hypothetical protein